MAVAAAGLWAEEVEEAEAEGAMAVEAGAAVMVAGVAVGAEEAYRKGAVE